jgi:hypothetical protein
MEPDNYFATAIHSFQQNLSHIEAEGRKESPDWHLLNGLLRLAQGLKQLDDKLEGHLGDFARSQPAK